MPSPTRISTTSWLRSRHGAATRRSRRSSSPTSTSPGASAFVVSGCPRSSVQGRTLLDDFLQLNREETVLVHKIRHSAFGYYEPLTPPHVFWRYGLDWHDIELMQDGDKLPVEHVADLLDMLLNKQPRFPTVEEIVSFHMDADAWERTFQRKRRRLVWLLRTAVKLGEDLAAGYDPGFGVWAPSPRTRWRGRRGARGRDALGSAE